MFSRPRCSAFLALSVDGFLARPDGSLDWLSIVERAGEDYGYQRFYEGVDAVVMGRATYDVCRGFEAWPHETKRVFVVTHRPGEPEHGEAFVAGSAEAIVAFLGEAGVKRAYVDGGAVIRQFLEAGLLDDIAISIVPILLGDGIPLFGRAERDLRLVLEESRSFPSGVVQVRYAPVGRIAT